MTKVKNDVFGVFGQGIKLYFSNFGSFFRYMAFPVFGQILGIIIILIASYFYVEHLQKTITPDQIYNQIPSIFLVLFLVTSPGILILVKAFWDYLVAYGAVNSMLDNMLKSGKVYDFHAHTEVINRRTASYGFLWGVLAVLGIISIIPLFWIIAGILFVYFVLVFQVFTFEPDKSVFGCFKKSVSIVKGNFLRTLGLIILVGIFSYGLIPELTKILFEYLNILGFLISVFDGFTRQLPIDSVNKLLLQTPMASYQINSLMLSKFFVSQLLIYVITSLTLPLRVICWGLWYKNLNKAEVKLDKRILARAEAKD